MSVDGELTGDRRRAFMRRMEMPIRVFGGLLLSLATMVLFGAAAPSPWTSVVELAVLVVMVATVLLFSMELVGEPPLIRLFSMLGFVWLCILFGMTLIDYATRGG